VPPTAAEQANQELVERLIAEDALWSRSLIAAFRATPRHAFLDRVFVYQRKANEWREVLTRDPGPEELRLVYSDRARITHLSPATRTGLQDWGRIGRIGDIAVYFGAPVSRAPRRPGSQAGPLGWRRGADNLVCRTRGRQEGLPHGATCVGTRPPRLPCWLPLGGCLHPAGRNGTLVACHERPAPLSAATVITSPTGATSAPRSFLARTTSTALCACCVRRAPACPCGCSALA